MPLLQAIFSGLALGSIYALIAFGFSVTYTTTKTFNFGQGEFLALGSLVTVSCVLMISRGTFLGNLVAADVTWVAYGAALLLNVLLLGLIGSALYFLAVKRFLGQHGLSWVMSTLGFGIIIQNMCLAVWGPAPIALPSPLGDHVISVFGGGASARNIDFCRRVDPDGRARLGSASNPAWQGGQGRRSQQACGLADGHQR